MRSIRQRSQFATLEKGRGQHTFVCAHDVSAQVEKVGTRPCRQERLWFQQSVAVAIEDIWEAEPECRSWAWSALHFGEIGAGEIGLVFDGLTPDFAGL